MDMGPAAIGLGLAFPILFTVGFGLAVIDSSPAEFFVARACIALAALDAVGFTVYWLWASEKIENWKWVAGGVIGAAVLLLLVVGLKWIDFREDQVTAKLFPGDKPMPTLPRNCPIPSNAVAVFFGSNVAFSSKFPYAVLNMGGLEMLSIARPPKQDALAVSTLRIFDDLGNIIVRIDSDGFWVAPSLRRKRPNKSTLIVFDRSDNEALHIEFLNPRALSVRGIFRDRRGRVVRITDDALILPGENVIQKSCFGTVRTAIMVR
jgi:hypothetical protein